MVLVASLLGDAVQGQIARPRGVGHPTVAGPTVQRFGASGPSAPVVLASPAQVR